MLSWLPTLIASQFALVFLLVAYTLLLLFNRKRRNRHHQKLSAQYHELLTDEVVATSPSPRSLEYFENLKVEPQIFQEAVFTQMRMVSGEQRLRLVKIYEQMGFKHDDLKLRKSVFWVQRLRALLHLGELEAQDLAPFFKQMISDPEPLVSTAAFLSLTRLKHSMNSAELVRQIPKSILKRSNALNEVLANIGIHHGTAPLVSEIRNNPSPQIKNASLRALRHLRSVEATHALNDLLSTPDSLDAHSILEIIKTLTQIGNPASLPIVRNYLMHESPSIRAESALFLMTFQDPETLSQIQSMREDPAIEIKRMFQVYDSLASLRSSS